MAAMHTGAGDTGPTADDIDHAFDALADLDRRIGPSLQFTPEGLAYKCK